MTDHPRRITAYLAGPMTGIEHYNYPAFNKAAAAIRDRFGDHLVLINPAELGDLGEQEAWTWSDYMREGVAAVASADLVIELPGVETHRSRGARLELRIARDLGIPVVPVSTLGFAEIRIYEEPEANGRPKFDITPMGQPGPGKRSQAAGPRFFVDQQKLVGDSVLDHVLSSRELQRIEGAL